MISYRSTLYLTTILGVLSLPTAAQGDKTPLRSVRRLIAIRVRRLK